MLAKRVIACLDVKDGRVVKGRNFVGLRTMGKPARLAAAYSAQGADEIVFLDIAASTEARGTRMKWVRETADGLDVPFTVGGGVSSIDDVRMLLALGADKVSINSAALASPQLVLKGAREFGSQCIVIAIDARKEGDFWKVYSYGGKTATGLDAIRWAKRCERLGAGELLLTSIDRDGTKAGFDCTLTRAVAEKVSIPVIASGGAGTMEDFRQVLTEGKADAALAAGTFHSGKIAIPPLKRFLSKNGVAVRC